MFQILPEIVEQHIWRCYYSFNVCQEVKNTAHSRIWDNPSDQLLANCQDVGSYQHTHSDLEKYVCCNEEHQHLEDAVHECFTTSDCGNCAVSGLPCLNAQIFGNLSPKIQGFWRI